MSFTCTSSVFKTLSRRCLFRKQIHRIVSLTRGRHLSSEDNERQYQESADNLRLYESHIATTSTQKVVLSIGSAIAAITDPYRHDMVAVFGETTGHWALRSVYQQMLADTEGRQIIEENPRINSNTINIEKLSKYPIDSFGRHYYDFLKTNNVTPDSRSAVKFVDDVQLAQVMQRYREIHDMVHTLLAMPTNMLGEVVVKWVEAIQTDLPMCWLGGLFGAVRLAPKQRSNYVQTYLPWALRCGHEARPLMNVYFEKRFEQNIEDMRRELNIPPIPSI